MPEADQSAIRDKVETFDDLGEDNDPGERHFGSYEHADHKVSWKINYCEPGRTFGSEDSADTAKTCRVLTIMLAEEY